MRLVSYNILDGGEGRADPLGEVIEAQKPDVVVLIEADDDTVVDRIVKRLKMDFVTGKGSKHSVAILTRWTIVESINHASLRSGFDACLLEASVRAKDGTLLPIGAIHLHAHAKNEDEDVRLNELGVVLSAFDRHRKAKTPHLLCGDFNSNSPSQQIDLAHAHPRTRKDAEANGGSIPRRAVEKVVSAGYVDLLHAYDAKWADTTGTFTTQHPQQRVDYCFGFNVEPSRLKSAWIEQDRLATYASDHYPIGVEITG
jgi:endonuclease/exonuclease/phosphatase family metal-dependent hydrolase